MLVRRRLNFLRGLASLGRTVRVRCVEPISKLQLSSLTCAVIVKTNLSTVNEGEITIEKHEEKIR